MQCRPLNLWICVFPVPGGLLSTSALKEETCQPVLASKVNRVSNNVCTRCAKSVYRMLCSSIERQYQDQDHDQDQDRTTCLCTIGHFSGRYSWAGGAKLAWSRRVTHEEATGLLQIWHIRGNVDAGSDPVGSENVLSSFQEHDVPELMLACQDRPFRLIQVDI